MRKESCLTCKPRSWSLAGLLLAGLLVLAALPGAARAQPADGFSAGQLDQLLAPVALYPDVLLSQVLMAATYPLEVVAAARWSRQNPGLEGDAAVDAVAGRGWDDSVKALVAFPDLLTRMSEDLDWTQQLGDAFLYQEADVIDRIQALRAQAYAHGSLQQLDKVQVVREKEVIYIRPAQTQVVYVPYYNPRLVYGYWRWHAYPPVVWVAPVYAPGFYTSVRFYWGAPVRVTPVFYYSGFDWYHRHITVVHVHRHHHVHSRPQPTRWQHDPRHRRNASYSRPALQQRYAAPAPQPGIRQRMAGASTHEAAPAQRARTESRPQRGEQQQRQQPQQQQQQPQRQLQGAQQRLGQQRSEQARPERQRGSEQQRAEQRRPEQRPPEQRNPEQRRPERQQAEVRRPEPQRPARPAEAPAQAPPPRQAAPVPAPEVQRTAPVNSGNRRAEPNSPQPAQTPPRGGPDARGGIRDRMRDR